MFTCILSVDGPRGQGDAPGIQGQDEVNRALRHGAHCSQPGPERRGAGPGPPLLLHLPRLAQQGEQHARARGTVLDSGGYETEE